MKDNSEISAEILARTRELAPVAAVVRAHHERWDGSGYPFGLKGTAIPIAARIFAVLEAFDAMISDRPYRKAMSNQNALEEIKRCAGTQFDPAVVHALLTVIREQGAEWLPNSAASGTGLFPPNSLANGQAGATLHVLDARGNGQHANGGMEHHHEPRRIRYPARF